MSAEPAKRTRVSGVREPSLRPARAGDLPAVVALLERAGLPTGDVGAELVDSMCVAHDGDRTVGSGAVEKLIRSALLRSVVVDAALRGSGLGARIVRDRLSWCAARGVESVYLLTTTAPAFFARLGFEVVSRSDVPEEVRATREYSTICPASAVVMKRAFGAETGRESKR